MSQQTSLFDDHRSEEEETVILAVKGRTRNNNNNPYPRKAAIGIVIDGEEETVAQANEFLGQGKEYTSNLADYRAVICGIQEVKQRRSAGEVRIEIRCNNEFIVKQLNSRADAKKMKRQHRECRDELRQFSSWGAKWVAKGESRRIDRADDLANEVLDTS